MLSELDEQGVHRVKTVLTIEHHRCTNHDTDPAAKPFNGISFAGKTFQTNEEK